MMEVMMEDMITQDGDNVSELSRHQVIMLVFLRHFGCTFCRESLCDLARAKADLLEEGVLPVLVHMVNDPFAAQMTRLYELDDLPRVNDPDLRFYKRFGLKKGGLSKFCNPRVFIRGIVAGLWNGHLIGKTMGNAFQMPGVFVVKDGKVVNAHVHHLICDRPDYTGLLRTG